jgi:hypothetical protein
VVCGERDELLRAYTYAVSDMFRASNTLSEFAGTSLLQDYALLLRERDRAKVKATEARSVYEQHIARHACEVSADLS